MKIRNATRVVLFDPDNRVLLQNILPLEPLSLKMDSVWITPGGQIDKGESFIECAERELYEETGIKNCIFGPVLWHSSDILKLKGEQTIFAQHFIYARAKTNQKPTKGDDSVILENRWWKIDDLITQNIDIHPFKLPKLLKGIDHDQVIQRKVLEI